MRWLTRWKVTRWVGTVLAAVIFADTAAAHGGHPDQLAWNWEPWVMVCLGLAVFGYAHGLRRLGTEGRSRVFGGGRCWAFAAGIATLFAALISPIDALDDQLFAAHMVQHLLLMMVAAPLLVWARPAIGWLWAFPLPARRAVGRIWLGTPGLRRGINALSRPLPVWLLCSVVLWFWHLPGPYGWALASETVHALEHLSFFLTALAFWSLVLEPYGRRRLDYGATLLFVATLGLQNGLLGALLVFAGRPLYAAYAQSTIVWDLTPLEDQQLAGLIMWVPAGLIHLGTLAVLFVAWMQSAERRATNAAALAATALRCALVLPLLTVMSASRQADAAGPSWQLPGGDARRGPALIRQYGCAACHTVPGVDNANGNVGPPLSRFADRTYIAGMLRNTPDNLIRWLRKPQSVVPGNAMPNMGVTEQDARDIGAYLYTLR